MVGLCDDPVASTHHKFKWDESGSDWTNRPALGRTWQSLDERARAPSSLRNGPSALRRTLCAMVRTGDPSHTRIPRRHQRFIRGELELGEH